jgi:hypothetical protein
LNMTRLLYHGTLLWLPAADLSQEAPPIARLPDRKRGR